MKKCIILIALTLSLALCSCGSETQETQETLDTEQTVSEQNSKQESSKEPEQTVESDVQETVQEEPTVSTEQVMESYQEILRAEQLRIDSANKAGKGEYGYYVLGDINQDGICELMVLSGSCEADETWQCYSHNGESAYQVGTLPVGHTNLCSGQDGIYFFYAQMGCVEIKKIIWEGGTEDIQSEITYTTDTNDFMTEDYDALLQTFGLTRMDVNDISDYELLRIGPADEADNSQSPETVTEYEVIPVVEGNYWEGDKSPEGALYYIQISNSTGEGFDFEIFGRENMEELFSTVFKYHTAVYISSNSAAYYGQNYTLIFHWTQQGYLSVDGFTERIPSEDVLYNNDYLGVS